MSDERLAEARERVARDLCDIDGFTNLREPRASDYIRATAALRAIAPLLDAARREAWDEGYWDAKAGAMSGQTHVNPYGQEER